jgi:zinc transporter 9
VASEGKSAVFLALVGNAFLTAIKFGAFALSGSGAMMSEAVHSLADTANQALLYVGVQLSQRPADERFQSGYGPERFLFALLSAMGIFVLGCGVTVHHGVHSLLHPAPIHLGWPTFAVLAISFVVDGYVLLKAVSEINTKRGARGFFAYIFHSTDPTLIAVLFEDCVATSGVVIAAAGIGLSYLTGDPIYDALSSIGIGLLLGVLAIWLGYRNRVLILGPAISRDEQCRIVAFLERQESIRAVRALRSRVVAADGFRVSAEVSYNGAALGKRLGNWAREQAAECHSDTDWEAFASQFAEKVIQCLATETDRIEAELHKEFPELHNADLEAS